MAMLAAAIWLARRRWVTGGMCVLAALGCGTWSYGTVWYHNRPVEAARSMRVLFWNAMKGRLGRAAVAQTVRSFDPDVAGLVEAPGTRAFWQREFPEHAVSEVSGGTVLMSRGGLAEVDSGRWGRGGRYRLFAVEVAGRSLHVVLVDVRADLWLSRRRPLGALARLVAPMADDAVLVMGDFNTPTDSVFFRDLRQHFVNAFESAGSGYAATWPMPLPVLTLDQVWASERVRIHRCRLTRSWRSDHRPVLVEVSVLQDGRFQNSTLNVGSGISQAKPPSEPPESVRSSPTE
jgi:endonuclease/exonuclease/phosphatase (EEP) superfamily protein YafD